MMVVRDYELTGCLGFYQKMGGEDSVGELAGIPAYVSNCVGGMFGVFVVSGWSVMCWKCPPVFQRSFPTALVCVYR